MTDRPGDTRTVEELMGLAEALADSFELGDSDSARESLRSALTALVQSRDKAVEELNAREKFHTVLKAADEKAVSILANDRDVALKELAVVQRNYKEPIADFMPETEYLPGAKCDSYGHDDDCPVINAQASVHKLREDLKAALKDLERLKGAVKENHLQDDDLGNFCIFCQSGTAAPTFAS